jgi:anti-anti-sigma factor
VNEQSSFRVIRLSGELDLARRDEIRAALHVEGRERAVLVDLSAVHYADSTIIAELLRFRGEAQSGGRRLAVLIGDRRFARVLEYAGLNDAFALFEDRAAALIYLSEPAET